MSYNENNFTKCGRCERRFSPGENYCPICGIKRGVSAYHPAMNKMVSIYGPPPVERRKKCRKCGYEWSFFSMIDNETHCPKCGNLAKLIKEYYDEPYSDVNWEIDEESD